MDASLFERLVPWLATYWIHSTLLISAVWLGLRRRSALSPHHRQRAWKLALTLGLVTAPLQLSLQVRPFSGYLELDSAHSEGGVVAPVVQGASAIEPGPADVIVEPPLESAPGPMAFETAQDEAGAEMPAASDHAEVWAEWTAPSTRAAPPSRVPIWHKWQLMAGLLWVVVGLAGVARLLGVSLRMLNRRGFTPLESGSAYELLEHLRKKARLTRRVHLYCWRDGDCAVAWGLLRWHIAVPRSMLNKLNRRELSALLAHELGHLARGDTRWLWLAGAIGTVGFFQPLNRLAQRHIRREAEFLSDGWAVSQTNDPLALARCLTLAAELARRPARMLALGVVGGGSPLHDRVNRLLADQPPPQPGGQLMRAGWIVAGMGAIVALVAVAPGVRPAGRSIQAAVEGASAVAGADTGEELPEIAGPMAVFQSSSGASGGGGVPAGGGEQLGESLAGLCGELEAMDKQLRDLEGQMAGASAGRAGEFLKRIANRRQQVAHTRTRLRRLMEARPDAAERLTAAEKAE